ncbi:MAG: MFS transporter [Pseudomonadota bacterium]
MKSFLPLIKAEWRILLFGFAMTFGSSLGQTYFIGLFGGDIRIDLGLTHSAFGAVYSIATLVSAIILLWSGTLIDKLPLTKLAYLVIAGLALGCVLISVSVGVVTLFLSILILRHFGQGLMSMTGATTVVRYLDEQKGKANAVSGIGYSVSEAILPSIVIAQLAIMSWRHSWMIWAVLLLAVMPLATRWVLKGHDKRHARYLHQVSQAQTESDATATRHWTRSEVLRDPVFYLFLPALLAQPLLFTGFIFHQVYLVDSKGWSIELWGALYIVYAAVAAAVKLIAGLLVDRFGAIRLAPFICLPFGLGLFFLATSDSSVVALLFMVLLAVSIGAYSTISSPFYAEMYGSLHLGSIKSVVAASMVLASAIAPILIGWGIDRGITIDRMALVAALYTVIAAMLAAYAARSHRHRTAVG